ncbi:MAG: hypothetical protein JWM99_446 [Verrucomicrobiales bacterium]|nr:hypothetical protein [Verrucomicrobiales bacterium]
MMVVPSVVKGGQDGSRMEKKLPLGKQTQSWLGGAAADSCSAHISALGFLNRGPLRAFNSRLIQADSSARITFHFGDQNSGSLARVSFET